jgi:hypothetical protein
MGLLDKLRGELIDIIEWTDPERRPRSPLSAIQQ